MQAGRILSSENIKNLSINYAESIGEDLIKEKINAWANQKGTVRINASFDNKISGDVLLPITESSDGLLFSQFGLHASVGNSRYVNIGVGYRKHINNWMYGVNTFYDYSYAGKHARAGIGGEMWADYMKLAVNGYYGLTDWHESRLSAMKDYDERPASGFDLRAEAYLPSYPQLGASLKYEQYFGEGIRLNIGSHADDLKDNPKALTFGLSYTPIPLITLKGEYSGGRKDASRIGINVNYRFGVPWAQQISIDGVKVLRSLMGSSYELVDRNNEIVMQYRKQDLLEISLPNTVTAEAAETITLPLTVSKDKYGLRDVKWTASVEFFANGGSFRKLSLTQLEVTLPSYLYTKLANTAQEYVIKAVGVDNNGNNSNPAATTIKVKPADAASAKIYALTADKDVAADNGKDAITFTTVVRDVAGAVVPG
ncbi:inverse autotransporter beta domain-containing protein [Edwardsiella anguillarum]|nr:inverse autotransporter beta domain-containing protein [Edwardsiella anguillarum]